MVMAVIGGHLAHQTPLQSNYCNGLVQPSLVMNHHVDCQEDIHPILATNIKKQNYSHCVGCGGQILDQYILQVAPDLEWHAACLKCQECRQFLDESCTCFVRDGKTYCKRDYVRLFGTKCDKCGCSFSKNDFVMRAKSKIFHLECFRCTACSRHLIPGDEFALRDGNTLFCKMDNDALDKLAQSDAESAAIDFRDGNNQVVTTTTTNSNNNSSGSNNNSSEFGSMSESESESGSHKNVRVRGKPPGSNDGKTRVRTVLNEKQLHTLSTFFNANPRPDALMKEQLVEMTGLSPRVIRVWFQNKRCKHNKKTNALKIQMEQEKEMKQIGYGRMHGVPLIATSPVRNDESPINLHGFDVTSFQPPWKMISDLAMRADSKNNGMHQMHSPAYQDIVNQRSPPDASSLDSLHGSYE